MIQSINLYASKHRPLCFLAAILIKNSFCAKLEWIDDASLHQHDDISIFCNYVGVSVFIPDNAETFFYVVGFSFDVLENVPHKYCVRETVLIHHDYDLVWVCAGTYRFDVGFFV